MSKSTVTDFGGTGKVVILLHGFMATSLYWRRLVPSLQKSGYRVITIDLLGFGRAAKVPAETYNYDEHVQHVADQIAALKLTQPFVLVGHSMGGLLAARYSIVHPGKIGKLVLLNPPLYKDRQQAHQSLRGTGKFYRFILDSRFRNLFWQLVRHLPNTGHDFAARELSLKNIVEAAELLADLQAINTPTELLIGLKDRPEYGENISKTVLAGHISVRTVHVGHHSPLFVPKQVLRIITADNTL